MHWQGCLQELQAALHAAVRLLYHLDIGDAPLSSPLSLGALQMVPFTSHLSRYSLPKLPHYSTSYLIL